MVTWYVANKTRGIGTRGLEPVKVGDVPLGIDL